MDNPILDFFQKRMKQKRTLKNLVNDLIYYLGQSPTQTGMTDKRLAIPMITREIFTDEAFAMALQVVAAKMLDLFDEKGPK